MFMMKLVKVLSTDDLVRQIIRMFLPAIEVHQHGVEGRDERIRAELFFFSSPFCVSLLFVLCCAIPPHLCVKREGSCKVLGLENIVAHKC